MTARAAIGQLLAASTVAVLVAGTGACVPARTGPAAPRPAGETLACHGPHGAVDWRSPGRRDQPRLDQWCGSVGAPVVRAVDRPPATIRRLLIVSWNVGVGAGRIAELVDLLRSRPPHSIRGDVGLVLLLQEAVRGGSDVPGLVPRGLVVPGAIRPDRPAVDVVDLARTLGLSLAYVPSMRNGPSTGVGERADRGNAILSTEPLSGVTAVELPFARQRRVAVLATVTPRGGSSPLRVIAAHLDTPGAGTARQAAALAGFIDGTRDGVPVILGIDTNAVFGRRDAIVRTLRQAVTMAPGCERGRTGPWRFARIDFILTGGLDRPMTCETLRDRYGSDHVPSLLTLDL